MKVSNLVKDSNLASKELHYHEERTLRVFRDLQNHPGKTIARKCIRRGILKPFDEYRNATQDTILSLYGKLYAVPRAWGNQTNTERTKRQKYIDTRQHQAADRATNLLPLRYIRQVTIEYNCKPFIRTEDRGDRKYSKDTYLTVPGNWLRDSKYSTDKFIVATKSKDVIFEEDAHFCSVTGWWKSEIKGDAIHHPTTAWLGYNEHAHTITNSLNTAKTGMRVRQSNKVMKSLLT